MLATVAIYYLEMIDASQLTPGRSEAADLEFRQAEIPSPELNRYMYTAVGGDWYWIDRLGWGYDEWFGWVSRPEVETWIAYVKGTPAGYFELDGVAGGDVELAYIGLLPDFIGQGYGGRLLTVATERAWAIGASRTWLNTCTLDHPDALKNYLARGFVMYDQGTYEQELPNRKPGPWPGARG
ncbi:MAG: GNAT family N-acetyltransferase [SAR202 cluster bacterium]|jgi:GNAT superfamily N-acetyltransferase|nr:GNAT family N-acetyltransferase [SAR202 cluster bacterium]MDP7104519.1 GNAT family N-acetyltransferase [SAR202 cluster bacterium]MDP7226212.1 GNAT family N-acetyltransferase [SAR202 cluster bacterium]MDP7414467.1 GNAT family N-acetyltransferase [SAR202 cluster bacterium]MDP7533873.1 GNAT family N-acetyltransferase [SAR202 cluster bacterium]|tara:strand:- start:3642 stop:4187 length:546 start_codon:yes stop_codon:yes gene_type:complete